MPKQKAQTTSKFKTFSKYDFVKSFVATNNNLAKEEGKEKEAVIIADTIEESAGFAPFDRNKFIELYTTLDRGDTQDARIKQAILIADALEWRQETILNYYHNQQSL